MTLALLLGLGAPAARGAPPQPLRIVEGVSEYRLDNGLQVLLIPDTSKPTVTVSVTYRAGSRMEGAGETGMAHLLEHLMFKTTAASPNVGAELSRRGLHFNGSTTADRTHYFETFPADPAQLDWVLGMEADRMTGAKLLRSDLDSEMTVVRNEMEAGENDPMRILRQLVQSTAYQWHAYGRSTIGARSDVENVDIPRLQDFYRRWYQPDDATLAIAGAFEPQATLRRIVETFGALPRPQRALPRPYTVEPVQEGEREVVLRRRGGQQALIAAYHIPALAAPEFAAFEVLGSALADEPTGRLHHRLVETGKATAVFGWAERRTDPGLAFFGAVLKKDDPAAPAEASLRATVEELAREPVTQAELDRVKLQWAAGFEKIMADPQRLCLVLSEAIAAGDWRLLLNLRDRVQAISLAEVNAAAQRWLIPSNRTLGRFVPTDAPLDAPAAGPVDAASALKDFKPRAAVAAGENFEPTPANIDARTERYALPSGLEVALLRKGTRGGLVELVLRLQAGDLQSLSGQRAAAGLVASLAARGTTTRSRAQLSDAFDALKTDWSLSADALGGVAASLSSRRESLVPAIALLAEVMRQPAMAEDEFAQLVRERLASLERAADDPAAVASQVLAKALSAGYPADDPRRAPDFADAIATLNGVGRESLIALRRDLWGAGHAELAVVGDFDPDAVKAAIAAAFGDWTAATPYARIPQPPASLAGARLNSALPGKANATLVGALPLALRDDDPDAAPLELAVRILGGAGAFDSRLIARLRQKDGLSYGAGARLGLSSVEASGSLRLIAIFAPENRARVEQGFAEELQRFVADGVTDQELADAKKAVRSEAETRRASDRVLAAEWAANLELDRDFAWAAKQEAALDAATVEQVDAVIRRWIQPAKIDWSFAGDLDKAK